MSLIASDVAKRTSLGKAGKPCQIRVNMYQVNNVPDKIIRHYDVDITDITRETSKAGRMPAAKNYLIMRHFENVHLKGALGGIQFVYDGQKNLYAHDKYSFERQSFEVVVPKGPQGSGGTYRVAIRYVAAVDLTTVDSYIKRKTNEYPSQALNVWDCYLQYHLASQYVVANGSAYWPQGASSLGSGVELWKGCFQSARVVQGGLFINADVSSCALVQGSDCISFAAAILPRCDPNRGLSDGDCKMLERRLKGLQLQANHRGENKIRRKCLGISNETPNQIKFSPNDTEPEITVTQYFKSKYNLTLRYPNMPCIVWGSKERKIRLPMEVCSIVPGQRYRKTLTPDQVAAVIKFTVIKPAERQHNIAEGMKNVLKYKENPNLLDLRVQISAEQTLVPARILPTPSLKYGRDVLTPREGKWNLLKQKFHVPCKISSWGVVSFGRCRLPEIQIFVTAMVQVFKRVGIECGDAQPPIVIGRPQEYEKDLRRCAKDVFNKTKQNPSMILFIMNSRDHLYNAVKNFLECKVGIPSQCVLDKNVSKAQDQTCTNITMKINAKMDGVNTAVATTSPIMSEPTMVVGADVNHGSPGSPVPSIAAVVASLDRDAFKYGACVRLLPPRQESISNLEEMMLDRLRLFHERNKRYPMRIIFYRDGVSFGQHEAVRKNEISAINRACKTANIQPKITFIVVGKRHHIRMFPQNPREALNNGNVMPGTVVDDKICHPVEADFYLVSHNSVLGTGRPTHYHILIDENNLTPDVLQQFTYNMCYTQARCTRSVSVPPPVYYADLLAYRARSRFTGGLGWDTASEATSLSSGAAEEQYEKLRDTAAKPTAALDVRNPFYFC